MDRRSPKFVGVHTRALDNAVSLYLEDNKRLHGGYSSLTHESGVTGQSSLLTTYSASRNGMSPMDSRHVLGPWLGSVVPRSVSVED